MRNQSLRDSLIMARKSNPANPTEKILRRFSPQPSESTTLGHNNPIDTESLDAYVHNQFSKSYAAQMFPTIPLMSEYSTDLLNETMEIDMLPPTPLKMAPCA